jgi:hypothetical protein
MNVTRFPITNAFCPVARTGPGPSGYRRLAVGWGAVRGLPTGHFATGRHQSAPPTIFT